MAIANPKIFLLGVTGYIGGDALYAIAQAHPDWQLTALVRNSDKGAQVAAKHPKVRLVYGDLDATDLIKSESEAADIVLNNTGDHLASTTAIVEGLVARGAKSPQSHGYFIQVSGTGMLAWPEYTKARSLLGSGPTDKVWDDEADAAALTATIKGQAAGGAQVVFPDSAAHRKIEEAALDAAKEHPNIIRSAVVSPPLIYGQGRGPGNTRSIQIPDLVKGTLERKQAFKVGEGTARWAAVHVADLSDVYVLLVEDAVAGGKKGGWGPDNNYYFTENEDFSWAGLSGGLAERMVAKKLLPNAELTQLTADEADKIRSRGGLVWGTNSRSKAKLASKFLGWNPQRKLADSYDEHILYEATELGIVKKHGDVAGGSS